MRTTVIIVSKREEVPRVGDLIAFGMPEHHDHVEYRIETVTVEDDGTWVAIAKETE